MRTAALSGRAAIEARQDEARRKVIDNEPLTDDDENILLFGDLDNMP